MDMEAATSAADPSSNPFAAPFKPSPAGPPDSAPSPDGLHADGDLNNHHLHHDNDDSGLHDEEDGLAYNHDLHHSHHNGHGANDIMTSSFYGNGDGNRDLFGDPEDLGPETHVDLLDDQDGMMMDMGQAAEEEYKARAMEFGMEDQHDAMRPCDPFSKDGYMAEGGDYVSSNRVDMIITEEQETMLEEEDRDVEDDVHHVMVHQEVGEGYNPFKAQDWTLPKSEQKADEEGFGGEGVDSTQFAEEPSTRQHYDDGERQERLLAEEEEVVGVIQYKEEPALEKEQVVQDEEVIEVGGGSGLEEADDDSEEEGEWKYVSSRPGEGGAVVPEAISPEAALPDETSCSPALPEQELLEQQHLSPSASPALPPRLEHGTVETAKVEEEIDSKSDTSDLKAELAIADDDKFCQDLGFEVVQKTHVEEVCEAGVLEKPVEQEREPLGLPELDLLGGKSPQHIEDETEDSTMESRLNPDAAEFVPVSPTQLVNVEPYPAVDDFDTFKKEAGECPGEISEDPATPRTPKAFLNIGVNDDVLSSSFGLGTPKHADMFQEELSSNVPDLMSSGNEYLMNDDDKENISQEGEDKENMSQQITVSDVDSALNRSFEVREELSSGNEKVSDILGSPVNFSAAESKDESEIVCETSGRDLMSEFVSGISEPETSLHEVPSHEISAPHEVVDEIADLASQISQAEEISFNQSNDFMHSSHVEDFMKPQDIPENQSKDEEHIEEHFQMEFSPVKHTIPPVEPMEEAELVMVHPETPENLEPTPSPNLQICTMKVDDLMEPIEPEVKEEVAHSQFVMEDFQKKEQPDDLMLDDRQVNIPVESMEDIQTHEADMANFHAEPIVKVEQEFAPVDNVEPALEPNCVSPILPSKATELSSIIEGSQSLSLEEKVPALEENIQKIEDEIIESINTSSGVELVPEISQSFENDVCSPMSEKITSTEPAVDEFSAKEQVTSEVITPADVSGSEPLVEELPKETVTESIPEDVSKAADIGSAAAVAAAVGVAVTAAGVASSAKAAPKKPTTADKKPLSDKSKPSSATAAKPTTKTTKPPATAASKTTAAPKKPAAPSTNKTAPVPAARTSTAERKPLTSTAKPAPTSKPSPASATSLASKAKTLGAKPSAASTTKAGALPRTSAPPARPSTAAPKTSTTTTASKPVPARPATAPAKSAEPKKMMNGDATKPASTATTRAPLAKKPTTTSTTTASKTTTTTTTRVSLSARSTTSKPAADPAKTSTKPAAGAVNGAVPKTTPRTSLAPRPGAATAKPSAPAAKPSAAAPARTKPSTTPQKTTPTAPGIAKKAKESVNKHISATRLSGVGSAKQSPISKTESPKSVTKPLTNGTPGKKPEAKSNSKVVEAEEKELRINGITLDCNNEKLDGVVAIEDGVHEAKEQMVLMGDALSIGEAV